MSAPPSGRRTNVRFQVLAFLLVLGGISYLDRVCISTMAPAIRKDLDLSEVQMGLVFSAFTLAYAIFEMPTGAWGDRIGTRRVITRIVLWWSSFTIATAAAWNFSVMLVVRFLFGAGEAGAFPNVTKTFSRWFPLKERGTSQGLFFAGVHMGGGVAQMLVALLLMYLPWRAIFVLFGLVGFVWAVAWFRWFRDDPALHPAVNGEELTYIVSGRGKEPKHHLDLEVLKRIFTDRSLVALCAMYFTQAYGFYFNLTWLPTYLKEARGYSGVLLGLFSGLPFVLSSGADLTGGVTTDWLTSRYGLRVGRCGLGAAALVVAGLSLAAGALVANPIVAGLLIALAGAAASFLLGAAWGVCQDIAGPHAGLVSGCMNTAGQLGAVLSPVILPFFTRGTPADWVTPLVLAGGLNLMGAALWWFVDPRVPIKLPHQPEDLGE